MSNNSYPWFFFYRIARLSFVVFLPLIFLILFFYRDSYRDGLVSQMDVQVEESLRTIHKTLIKANTNWKDWCKDLHPEGTRYLLINRSGKIVCDSLDLKTDQELDNKINLEKSFENTYFSFVDESEFFKTKALFSSLIISNDLIIRKTTPITSLRDDMNRFDRVIFLKIVPFSLLCFLIYLIGFYFATKPLGSILKKVENFKLDTPTNHHFKMLYRRDEWSRVQATLNEADSQIKAQIINIKNENEKIATILESINDSILAIDPYETIQFHNSNFRREFINPKNAKEITPRLWHKISNEEVLEAFRKVLRDGISTSLKNLNNMSYTHPERFYNLTITPMRNAEGKIIGALGVFYDVTEMRKTEQMRVDFVANVSHEIRTPLTSIKGFSQILDSQKAKISDELHPFIGKIISNTERMISLFSDLLDLSVIESQQIMKFDPIDLEEIIPTIAASIITNYPNKEVDIEQNIQLKFIEGDQRLIEQVLTNLIDNACKYSDKHIRVKVSSFRKNEKSYIIVSDNGPGISKEHLSRIFERFYRVDPSREVSRGTGLGLSIVKHIIHKHGGTIWVESELSSGTNFVIELP